MVDRVCKDCETGTRPAPHPGPRCATHWREEKKRRKARAHEARVQKTYGLAEGGYDELCEFQDGLCAICRRAKCVGVSSKHLAVDHNHDCCPGPVSCGECIRGLLCVGCNHNLLGAYGVEALQRAIEYLTNPPYERMLAARMHASPAEESE